MLNELKAVFLQGEVVKRTTAIVDLDELMVDLRVLLPNFNRSEDLVKDRLTGVDRVGEGRFNAGDALKFTEKSSCNYLYFVDLWLVFALLLL